jgi:aquaporin Z
MNPAVTLAFAARGVFPWRYVPAYWLAEMAGAVLAALALRGLLGDIGHLGATAPGVGLVPALLMEATLVALLVSVILGTATHHSVVGPNAAVAVGGTVALCGLIAHPVSGASMNPARSLGPAIVSHSWGGVWIYAVGPIAGALLAVVLAWLLHGGRDPEERSAAEGEGAA